MIERAVLWSRGPMLDVEHLALEAPSEPPVGATASAAVVARRGRPGWTSSSGSGR